MLDDDYMKGVWTVGGVVFLGGWAYAVSAYGFFLGLGLGWVPALVLGALAGFLWPLVLLAVGGLGLYLLT